MTNETARVLKTLQFHPLLTAQFWLDYHAHAIFVGSAVSVLPPEYSHYVVNPNTRIRLRLGLGLQDYNAAFRVPVAGKHTFNKGLPSWA